MPRLSFALVIPAAVIATMAVGLSSADAAAVSGHNPVGYFDSIKAQNGGFSVSGWTADPDSSASATVIVTVDKVAVAKVTASGSRPDVASVYPALGAHRGFSASVAAKIGAHNVCLSVGNIGTGSSSAIGCRAVTVASAAASSTGTPKPAPPTKAPIGYLDATSYSKGTVYASGWSIDPDTTGAVRVEVTVNDTVMGKVLANLVRTDVAKAYPRSGAAHGFSAAIKHTLDSGNYRFCAVAKNTGAGASTSLGCRIVTVLPVGEPSVLNTATASQAAAAMQAQAIASGAARAVDFPVNASSAARIAIAARALLQQANGRLAAPVVKAGIPKFTRSTTTAVVDVQSVMGVKPSLGSYPAAKTGGRAGANRSLEVFGNDPVSLPGAAGDGIVGAAAVLPANGRTVRPSIPGYAAGHVTLRAEIAVSNALSLMGAPYVYAAAGPGTFDCSGMTQWAWGKAGVNLYHYTVTQAGQGVRVQPNQMLPGDLVLFGKDLHHVGMYLGAGYMLDAPYTGAYVRVDKISAFGDFTLAVRP